ncbi:MAG: DUF6544 family protein [Gemmatimonadaceae bacterium]
MRLAFIAIVLGHGAIHMLGAAKAFGWAAVPQLGPVSRRYGVLWLLAAGCLIATAILLLVAPSAWWIAAVPGIVVSQVAIVSAWGDAKFGTVANVLIALPTAVVLMNGRPGSLRSQFAADTKRVMSTTHRADTVASSELTDLPPPVRRYLVRAGVVGQARPYNMWVEMRARMRGAPDADFMNATVRQLSTFNPPARYFFMKASRAGIPVDVLHRYVDSAATMQARVAGLISVMDASGHRMTQGETVTLLNDMCLMAPAALLSPAVSWTPLDDRTAIATFTNAGHRVSARLTFNADDELVNFVSEDRFKSDGTTYVQLPWSTPLSGYRRFGPAWLAGYGEGRWTEARNDWTYGEFHIDGPSTTWRACRASREVHVAAARRLALAVSWLLVAASALAAMLGLWTGAPYHDNLFVTSAWFGNDLVTLFLGAPLLALATFGAAGGSPRWTLVWLGMLDFTLYNYLFYLFGAALNAMFLLYVLLVLGAIVALVVGFTALAFTLPDATLERRHALLTATASAVIGLGLGIAWVLQSIEFVVTGTLPGIVATAESRTNVVGALDLLLVVPLMLAAAILLWRRNVWGVALGSVVHTKGVVYMVSLSAATANAGLNGYPEGLAQIALWALLGLVSMATLTVLLRSVRAGGVAPPLSPTEERG